MLLRRRAERSPTFEALRVYMGKGDRSHVKSVLEGMGLPSLRRPHAQLVPREHLLGLATRTRLDR